MRVQNAPLSCVHTHSLTRQFADAAVQTPAYTLLLILPYTYFPTRNQTFRHLHTPHSDRCVHTVENQCVDTLPHAKHPSHPLYSSKGRTNIDKEALAKCCSLVHCCNFIYFVRATRDLRFAPIPRDLGQKEGVNLAKPWQGDTFIAACIKL